MVISEVIRVTEQAKDFTDTYLMSNVVVLEVICYAPSSGLVMLECLHFFHEFLTY